MKKEEIKEENKDENSDKSEADSTKLNEENEAKTSEKQASIEKNDDNEKDSDEIKTEVKKDNNKENTETDCAAAVPEKVKKPAKTMEVEEYLVKFKNFSYLHCQWLTEVELLKGDKRVSNKVSISFLKIYDFLILFLRSTYRKGRIRIFMFYYLKIGMVIF